jgi:signal transduction histidine kinase/ActR/RegA family two-component response regulator
MATSQLISREFAADEDALSPDELRLLRRIVVAMFVLGALNEYLGLFLPGATTGGRVSELVLAVVLSGAGLVLAIGPPRLTLLRIAPLFAIATVTATCSTTRPLSATPLFYLWPIVTGAYFFSRRYVVVSLLWMSLSFGLALTLWIHATTKTELYVSYVSVMALMGAVVSSMREHQTQLITQLRLGTRELAAEALHSARARDEAVEASNAKSVFVATVSHELRSPLSGVIGTAGLLLETPLNVEQREYAEIVRSSSEGLLLVINDILDYSKIEAGKLELDPGSFALSELVAESCALMLPIAREKGIELDIDAAADLPPWLYGDADRLRQVLINLLSNAVKFTEQGQVKVNVGATPADDGMLVRVEVSDTGIGIDADALERLFQPFTQADNSTARKYGGTGLGLTISAQLIEMMGGAIGASSIPQQGSLFWFEVALPLADQSDLATHVSRNFTALGDRDAAGNLTDAAPLVLVAEDNPVNQMLAVRQLDKCGYRAEVVNNGHEAVEAISHSSYVAVLMDCQMPELDGYDATREIRRRENGTTHLPIVATTAHSMSGDRDRCLAAGMDEYLSKPIRAAELMEALTHALTPSEQHSEPHSV